MVRRPSAAGRGALPALRLILRGLWWRRGVALALLVAAVVTSTAASLGPMYARAAKESTLNDHLTSAQWRTGISEAVEGNFGKPGSYPEWRSAVLSHGHVRRIRGYDRLIAGISSGGPIPVSLLNGTSAVLAQVVWRQRDCAHLIIVRGHCPTGAGQALASARSVIPGYYGWKLGTVLSAGPFTDPQVLDITADPTPTSRRLRIVGIYRPKDCQGPLKSAQGWS